MWKKILAWSIRFLVWNKIGKKLRVWNIEKSFWHPHHALLAGLDWTTFNSNISRHTFSLGYSCRYQYVSNKVNLDYLTAEQKQW